MYIMSWQQDFLEMKNKNKKKKNNNDKLENCVCKTQMMTVPHPTPNILLPTLPIWHPLFKKNILY